MENNARFKVLTAVCCIFKSSGMVHSVDGYITTDVSKKSLVILMNRKSDSTTILQNVRNNILYDAA
jgi:hypothetical protein